MTHVAAPSDSTEHVPRNDGERSVAGPSSGGREEWAQPFVEPIDLARIVLIAGAAAVLGTGLWDAFGHAKLAAVVLTLVGGYPIFKEAFDDIAERRMTMELSMTIALIAALLIGETFTALLITGVLTPVMAALMHVGSELMFIANSARLVPRGAASS